MLPSDMYSIKIWFKVAKRIRCDLYSELLIVVSTWNHTYPVEPAISLQEKVTSWQGILFEFFRIFWRIFWNDVTREITIKIFKTCLYFVIPYSKCCKNVLTYWKGIFNYWNVPVKNIAGENGPSLFCKGFQSVFLK